MGHQSDLRGRRAQHPDRDRTESNTLRLNAAVLSRLEENTHGQHKQGNFSRRGTGWAARISLVLRGGRMHLGPAR